MNLIEIARSKLARYGRTGLVGAVFASVAVAGVGGAAIPTALPISVKAYDALCFKRIRAC